MEFQLMKLLQNHSKTLISFKFFLCALLLIFTTLKSYSVSSVAITVNGNAITSEDIKHRIALLQLQQRHGDLKKIAEQELIDEMLKRIEAHRLNMNLTNAEINQAMENFAHQNHMSIEQLNHILNTLGISVSHFKDYIASQITWSRIVLSRYQEEKRSNGGLISEEDAAQRMLQNGGHKPSVNEYKLKQIILVIPPKKLNKILSKREKDAEILRKRIHSCNTIRKDSKGMLDLTIKDFGRILEPQLPPQWAHLIINTPVGHMTEAIRTPLGLEALVVCNVRKISDDRVAQLVFSIQDNIANGSKEAEALSKKYLKELHSTARIVYNNK